MKQLSLDQFNDLLNESGVKPRLKQELRFVTNTEHLSPQDWADTELLAVRDRSGNKGVLLLTIASGTYVLPYELQKIAPSSSTGRASAILCDFCMTWQSGTRAGSILLSHHTTSRKRLGYLCCLDLACSSHVRTKTSASKVSRAQVREDMDIPQRVERLHEHLENLVRSLDAKPIDQDAL